MQKNENHAPAQVSVFLWTSFDEIFTQILLILASCHTKNKVDGKKNHWRFKCLGSRNRAMFVRCDDMKNHFEFFRRFNRFGKLFFSSFLCLFSVSVHFVNLHNVVQRRLSRISFDSLRFSFYSAPKKNNSKKECHCLFIGAVKIDMSRNTFRGTWFTFSSACATWYRAAHHTMIINCVMCSEPPLEKSVFIIANDQLYTPSSRLSLCDTTHTYL